MSSPHAPSGHPHPDPAGPILQGPGLLLPASSPKPPEFISGPRHWGAERGLCWGLQEGPRVTAAPRGRWRTWAPSSGRKGLRVLLASVSDAPFPLQRSG